MEALSWIGEIASSIGKIIPRLIHIRATHEGVLFKLAGTKKLKPGLHIYHPLWSEPLLYPIKRQTLDLPPQVLITNDDKTILVTVTIVYDINDIEKALVETFELEDTIRDCAQGMVKSVITTHDYDALRKDQENIDKQLKRKIWSELYPYGVRVLKAFLSDLAPTDVYRCVTDPRSHHHMTLVTGNVENQI